jgi:hypothetical protein
MSQLEQLRGQAKQAFEAEMAREKTGDCKDTRSTLDTEICLEKESKISESN